MGGTDDVLTAAPFYIQGQVFYVDSVGGNNSNSGLSQEAPLKNLTNAVSAASNGDVIILLPTHNETISTTVTVNKALTIIGSGTTSGKPSAKLTLGAATAMINVTANGVELRNIYVPENPAAGDGSKVTLATGLDHFLLDGCYFEIGDNDTKAAVYCAASAAEATNLVFRDSTFVSTATVYAAAIPQGLLLFDLQHSRIEGCVFNGGDVGFGEGAPITNNAGIGLFVGSSLGSTTYVRIQDLSLLNGADATITIGSGGRIAGVTTSGAAKLTCF